MQQRNGQLQLASRGAVVGIIIYLLLSTLKLSAAYFFHSASLRADGLNNLTDIISSILIFVGLRIARQPADTNHHYGHTKFEPIASFTTSLIMFTVGIEVIKSSFDRFMLHDYPQPDIRAILVGGIAACILGATYLYIKKLAIQTNSLGLKASAKDLFSDMLTTCATMIAIACAAFGMSWLDLVMACVIGALIIYTAYNIFRESTFVLSDGFDPNELELYRQLILKHPQIRAVTSIRGRLSGSSIYIDVTVEIDGDLSVIQSHHITQEIEQILAYNYGVRDVDVHVEPFFGNNM